MAWNIHVSLLVYVFAFLGNCHEAASILADRRRLVTDLLAGYNKMIVADDSTQNHTGVTVSHGLSLSRVLSLDSHILNLDVHLHMKWTDSRLVWEPEEYGEIWAIRLPSRELWQPDIILQNSAGQFSGFPNGDINMVIFSDGQVDYKLPLTKLSSYCVTNTTIHTNDEVTCPLRFISWSYGKSDLDLRLMYNNVPLYEYNKDFNKVWTVTATSATVDFEHLLTDSFPYIDYTVRLRYGGLVPINAVSCAVTVTKTNVWLAVVFNLMTILGSR